jgi:putative bacteriocin precursor
MLKKNLKANRNTIESFGSACQCYCSSCSCSCSSNRPDDFTKEYSRESSKSASVSESRLMG